MAPKRDKPAEILPNNLPTFDYLGKFTLTRGDIVWIKSKSTYTDKDGVVHKTGVTGRYVFSGVAGKDGIFVRELRESSLIYVYLGKERTVELTGTILRPHILSLPKKKVPKSAKSNKTK